MKIIIKADIFAHTSHLYRGRNPSIFHGQFEADFSKSSLEEISRKLGSGEVVEINKGGIHFKVPVLMKRERILKCRGNLIHVSPSFFEQLKKAGWILDEKAAAKYGYPCEEKEKALQAQYKKEIRNLKRSMRLCRVSGRPKLKS